MLNVGFSGLDNFIHKTLPNAMLSISDSNAYLEINYSNSCKRVVLVENHPLIKLGILGLINSVQGFKVIGEASTYESGKKVFHQLRPDLVFLDVHLLNESRGAWLEDMKSGAYSHKLILLCEHLHEKDCQSFLGLGVRGILLKNLLIDDLEDCLLSMELGENYLSPCLEKYKHCLNVDDRSLEERFPGLTELSKREKLILKLIAEKKTTRGIADTLFNSIRTIENHRYRIAQKIKLDQEGESLLSFVLDHKSYFLHDRT